MPIGVNWSATGGTIDAGGLYTAGRTAGTLQGDRDPRHHRARRHADRHRARPPRSPRITLIAEQRRRSAPGRAVSSARRVVCPTGPPRRCRSPTRHRGSISVNGYYIGRLHRRHIPRDCDGAGRQGGHQPVTITATAPPPPSSVLFNADFEMGVGPTGPASSNAAPAGSPSSRPRPSRTPPRPTRAEETGRSRSAP